MRTALRVPGDCPAGRLRDAAADRGPREHRQPCRGGLARHRAGPAGRGFEPGPRALGLPPHAAGRVLLRCPIGLGAARRALARRAVLPPRERRRGPAAAARAARRGRARRARAAVDRRLLHRRQRSAVPGVRRAPQRAGAAVQPLLLRARRGHAHALRGVGRRLGSRQSPHAQQAVHRRRRGRGDRRAQHRRRVFPAPAAATTSSTWTPSSSARWSIRWAGCSTATGTAVRSYPLQSIARSPLEPAQQREWFERITGPEFTAAPPSAAGQRHPRLRADSRGPRRRPARPDLGRGPRLCRPPRQALRRRGGRRAA